MKRDDGGPAFPRPMSTDDHQGPCNLEYAQTGMTLRQWYKGQALIALVQVNETRQAGLLSTAEGATADYVAQMAAEYADAMIAEEETG